MSSDYRRVPLFALALLVLLAAPRYADATTCPAVGPVAANAKTDVVYDPLDSTMKACVAGSWLTMSGGGGGGGNLDDMTDVVITTPSTNQALVYNGAAWINATLSLTETDPQVGTLTATKWCAANAGGTAIDCTLNTPSGPTSSGTAGYVQLSDGSGAFTASGTTAGEQLFWDNTNKRLGIGKANPGNKLSVQTSTSLDGIVLGDGTRSVQIVAGTAGSGSWNGIVGANDNGIVFSGGAQNTGSFFIAPWATGTKGLKILGASGNVGIGTASPTEQLEINGNLLLRTAGAARYIYFDSTAGGSISRNSSTGNLEFAPQANAIFTSGNVGIGTPSPQTKLSVSSTANGSLAYISGLSYGLRLGSDGTNGANIDAVDAVNGITSYQPLWIGGSIAKIHTGGTERVRVDSSGNVGIGTTNPSNKLEVATGSGGVLAVGDDAGGYTRIRFFGSAANSVVFNRGNNTGSTMWWGEGSDTGAYSFRGSGNFEVGGAAYKPGGGSWSASSDARLKAINGPYQQGLDSIVKLNTVRFHYKKDNPRKEPSDRQFVGLIAQDVQKVFPEAVKERADGYLDLDTTPINFALINAVKELKTANDNLAHELAQQKSLNEKNLRELRDRLDTLSEAQ